MIADAMRGVDVLMAQPDVDPARIGVTGNSGGGTQSCYHMLLDPRLAAAAPGTYVTTRRHVMAAGSSHDAEQNLFGAIARHVDYCDFVIGFAPRPVMMLAVTYDFFPIEGTRQAYAHARRAYRALGAESACRMAVDDQTHEYTPRLREAMARFFADVFDHGDADKLDLNIDALPSEAELRCTRSGQVLVDDPRAPSLLRIISDTLPEQGEVQPEQTRRIVRERVLGQRGLPPIHPRVIQTHADEDEQVYSEKLFFFSEPGVAVSGIFVRPLKAQAPLAATLVLLPDGTASFSDADLLTQLRRWWTPDRAMLVFDPRGTGGVICEHLNPQDLHHMYGPWFRLAYNAWMLGDDLAAMRAFDAVRALEYLRSRDDVNSGKIGICGKADAAFTGLLAAIADGNIQWACFDGLPSSYRHILHQEFYDRRVINEWTCLHGMLKTFDLPQLKDALPSGLLSY